jgi:predicted enzyme related to lactoylglutathione lyase
MSDPFELLRAPLAPIEPDPAYAAELRARIVRALELPKGVTVSNLAIDDAHALIARRGVITPYLAVSGAREALEWYRGAFGARLSGDPIVMGDGRVGHAELEIAGAPLMVSEEHPEIGVTAPAPGEGATVTIHLAVDDVDDTIERAVSLGAHLERPAADYEYGRNGVIRDPFGHRWMISGRPNPAGLRHGDIGYVSLWVPDVERAAAFFSAVLGWQYTPGSGELGRQVAGRHLHHGLWGGVEHATLFCCFAVDDARAAGSRVRAAGGTAGLPHEEPYGLLVDCTDHDGTSFAVFEPPGGTVPGPASVPSAAQGDLSYVTMKVGDSARARQFYGAVLGWRFEAGGSEDGWQVQDVSPMVGISGGHVHPTTVPMYRVDDVTAAVERVRDAGGEATEPEVQPYGISSICSDDQGTGFYLGQF